MSDERCPNCGNSKRQLMACEHCGYIKPNGCNGSPSFSQRNLRVPRIPASDEVPEEACPQCGGAKRKFMACSGCGYVKPNGSKPEAQRPRAAERNGFESPPLLSLRVEERNGFESPPLLSLRVEDRDLGGLKYADSTNHRQHRTTLASVQIRVKKKRSLPTPSSLPGEDAALELPRGLPASGYEED